MWRATRGFKLLGTYGRTPPARSGGEPSPPRTRTRRPKRSSMVPARSPRLPRPGERAPRERVGGSRDADRARVLNDPPPDTHREFSGNAESRRKRRRGWAGVRSAARAKKEQVVARVGQTDASRGRVVSLDRGRSVARRARSPKIRSKRNISRGFFAFPFARLRPLRNSRRDRSRARQNDRARDLPAARPPGFTPQYRPAPSKR